MRRAEQILGYGISDRSGERYYTVVDGVIYTDLFEGDVEIPNYTGKFKKAFNGKLNALGYYNEIHLSSKCTPEVTLDLIWGSRDFYDDIDGLLKWLEDNPAEDMLDEAGVESKKIEDFNVRYKDTEESQASKSNLITANWGYFIRRPLIIGVAREQKNDWRYF